MRNAFSIIGLFVALSGSAQNLVVNPFFIPSKDSKTEAQLYLAPGYSNPNRGTTDFYSRSASEHTVGIPANFVGSQDIAGSDHYAGIISYYDDLTFAEGENGLKTGYGRYSEYLQVELREALVAGTTYQISFDASLAENSGFASTLGFYLSEHKLNEANNQSLPYTAQFQCSDVIRSTEKWTPISTVYKAKGGEKFITVGRFNDKIQLIAKAGEPNNRRAYYYLSNVVVSKIEVPVQKVEEPVVATPAKKGKQKKDKGGKNQLPTVYFEINSADLDQAAINKLNELCTQLNSDAKLNITVEGHTDITGTAAENEVLANRRAETVKSYLLSKGITETRIKTVGLNTKDLADKKGPARNAKNRRVTLKIN